MQGPDTHGQDAPPAPVGPRRPAAVLEADLRTLLASITDPHLAALLARVFDPDSPTWRAFRAAPAAKHYHHAYRHGLLEHALAVAEGVSALVATFPECDRELAVAGALLHDVGKLEEYAVRPGGIEKTDLGRLAGHIPLGYYRVRRLIEELPGFPEATAQHLLHIVLAHHGSLEHGSPVVPATREAALVHHVDDLSARLGSFDRLEQSLPAGATWSAHDRALGAAASFAPAREPALAPVPTEAGPPPALSLFEGIAAA